MATVEAAMQANKFAKALQKKLRQLQELEAKADAGILRKIAHTVSDSNRCVSSCC
jgi:hypothetical protein